MNLLADESIDAPVVERLRADGHDVAYVAEMHQGISDDEVFDHANKMRSVLLTSDKDFGELVFRLHRMALGVILVRLSGLSSDQKAHMLFSRTPDNGRSRHLVQAR